MPGFTMIPPRGNHPMHGHFWVPIDDQNCWAWSFDYHPTRALTRTNGARWRTARVFTSKIRLAHSGRSPTRTMIT